MDDVPFFNKIDGSLIANRIQKGTILDIYTKFTFYYFQNIENQNIVETEFYEYLKKFKFLTYYTFKSINFNFKFLNSTSKKTNQNFNMQISSVICIEGKCLILEKINENPFRNLIKKLQDHHAAIIKYDDSTINEDENQPFYTMFNNIIGKNNFVKYTLQPIKGYLINRFFYPREYFINQSFFDFDKSSDDDNKLKIAINDFLSIDIDDGMTSNIQKLKNLKEAIFNLTKEEEDLYEFEQKFNEEDFYESEQKFKEEDFMYLKIIHNNDDATLHLAFHIKTFRIFMVKKINANSDSIKREIDFCNQHSHRCITPFYGFLYTENNKDNIIGIVYKFMCNGNLLDFMNNSKEKINENYAIMTIIRLFNGINYFFKNFLIHRDIKPLNILIDNEFKPFLSDFDTVLSLKNHYSSSTTDDSAMNINDQNIGSILYSSPEQATDENVSFPTDIFSLGLIVYFLYEKKDLNYNSNEKENPKITKCSENIQYLFENCIKKNIDDRLKNKEIYNCLYNEVKRICLDTKIINYEIIQILLEYIMLNFAEKKQLFIFIYDVFCSKLLQMANSKEKRALLYLQIGYLYENGDGFRKDYLQANKYYSLSIKEGNSEAYAKLGNLYRRGYGVVVDFKEAKKYYNEGFIRSSSNAAVALGDLYFNGYGVEKNYKKAKEYYEIAVKQENQYGYLNLGKLYENGLGVIQDYKEAIEYYILAALKKNSEALFILGNFYAIGKYVKFDVNIAEDLYILAINLSDIDAENVLAATNYNYYSSYNKKTNFLRNTINDLFYEHFEITSIINYGHFGIGSDDGSPNMIHYSNDETTRLFFLNFGKVTYQNLFTTLPNNSNVLICLGNFYYMRTNIDKNYLKAKCYYELARARGNSYGMLYLGLLYEKGYGVNQIFSKALKYYEESASLNNKDAYFFIGKLYFNGKGIGQNFYKARINFEKALDFKNFNSYLYLADIYFYGYGVDENYEKAFNYYKKAGELGNKDSLLNLGNIYLQGNGFLKKDYLKAKEYFKKSAKLSNPDACLALGCLYENGYGVPLNYSKALKYYKKLISEDDFILIKNVDDDDDNYNKKTFESNTVDISKEASIKNKSEALLRIGSFYEYGKGVNKNYNEAKRCYELSCKLQNSNAFLKLAFIYEKGVNEPKDLSRAYYYLNLACQAKNSFAFVNLGIYYENGLYVTKDYSTAKHYYELGSNEYNSFAFLHLGNLYEKGHGVEQNYLKAKYYYELSAKDNNADAFLKLGEFYYYGKGVEKNYKKALYYYQLSANEKNPDASYYLGVFYSIGNNYKIDIDLAIEYYTKNINSKNEDVEIYNRKDNSKYYLFRYNKFYNHSCNDLGLIYIIYKKDIEKAIEYINKASTSEFSFAQNNLGLLYQFYKNDDANASAEYKYGVSSRNGFTLAKYNLGFLEELKGEINKSINYYIAASEAENKPFMFRCVEVNDLRLEISKTFILCLTNLKLTLYFVKEFDYQNSKKYFIKAFSKLKLNTNDMVYKFHYTFNNVLSKDTFSYLKEYILEFPLFNLKNQFDFSSYLDQQNENKIQYEEKNEQLQFDSCVDDINLKKQNKIDILENFELTNNPQKSFFEDQGLLFDFIIKNNQLTHIFMDEINEIIKEMSSILYKPPYEILFGRISLEKHNENQQENINQIFRDGFNIS